MNENVFDVANSFGLWICGIIIVGIVIAQAVLYSKLSFKTAAEIDLSPSDCWKALRTGTISSIGPALAIFAVMLGTMSVIGAPLAWINTALIGSVATDLVGANIGAQVAGVELGGETFNVLALATSQWTMASNGIGFMLVAILFTSRLEALRVKMGGGDKKWIGILSIAATLGLFAYLVTPHAIAGGGKLTAALAGAIAMAALLKLSAKASWIKEYALGFAMIIGIVGGAIVGMA
jgi:hypothetical protein